MCSLIHFILKEPVAVDGKGEEQTGSGFQLWAEEKVTNVFASMSYILMIALEQNIQNSKLLNFGRKFLKIL